MDEIEKEMQSEQGKLDTKKLKDIVSISSKEPAEKFTSVKSPPKEDEDDEIDEFIKKHLEDEPMPKTEEESDPSSSSTDN